MSDRPKGTPPPPPLDARRRSPATLGTRRSRIPGSAAGQRGSLIGASARESLDFADAAQKLRDEQVRARVVFYEPQATTNAELDAITHGVIAELDALRRIHPASSPSSADDDPTRTARMDDEITLTAELRHCLELLLDTRRGFLRARLEQMSRRITTLFFEAALSTERWDDDDDDDAPEVASAQQAMWLAHARLRGAFVEALRAQPLARPEVLDAALDRLGRFERDLQTELLRHRAPELERLLTVLMDVFTGFFATTFRNDLGDFAWSVVRESAVARTPGALVDGHKVSASAFRRFREVFEKHFLERLALGVKDPLVARLDAVGDELSEDCLEFIEDPKVFVLVCELMCEAFYDHLQLEGVLDLPTAWRNSKRPSNPAP